MLMNWAEMSRFNFTFTTTIFIYRTVSIFIYLCNCVSVATPSYKIWSVATEVKIWSRSIATRPVAMKKIALSAAAQTASIKGEWRDEGHTWNGNSYECFGGCTDQPLRDT